MGFAFYFSQADRELGDAWVEEKVVKWRVLLGMEQRHPQQRDKDVVSPWDLGREDFPGSVFSFGPSPFWDLVAFLFILHEGKNKLADYEFGEMVGWTSRFAALGQGVVGPARSQRCLLPTPAQARGGFPTSPLASF